MKRENLYKTALALFALLLTAACGNEEFTDIPVDRGEPQEIRFDIAVATATPSGASTRVTTSTDGNYTSSFTAGDQVGLYIVKGEGGLQSSGNWVNNVAMSYDGTKWTCTLPEGKDCYPKDGSRLSFYAYYPYDAGLTNPLAMSFAVPADQSTAEAFASGYLMSASRTGVAKSHDPVQLTFSHKMAMVRVNLKDGAEAKDKAPRPADVVTLKGRQLTTSLNLATDAVGTSGTVTDVKMHYNTGDKCWYALVPEQVVDSSSVQLTFEWTHILTLKHTPQANFTLPQGEVKPLDITINVDMKIDPLHVYKVGDAYPHVGFSKKGVVFEVSESGKSGKIFSLKREYGLVWSTENVITEANNEENGVANMATIKARDDTFEKYPAFKWVHSLNPQGTSYAFFSNSFWYLPGSAELNSIFARGNEANKEKVARTLEALGMKDPFFVNVGNRSMWCSTESYNNCPEERARQMSLKGGVLYTVVKADDVVYTWPIMAF